MKKFAVIDIGSNSVRLMLWANGKTLYKKIKTTRLGAGLADKRLLGADAIERSVAAICDFQAEAKGYPVYAFATAAVRSAENRSDFCACVKSVCGLSVDVVSGEAEALLGLNGALGRRDGGVVDIGGASTEVCVRDGGKIVFSESIPLGAVRLYDLCRDDPVKLEHATESALNKLRGCTINGELYAVGGTAATLAGLKCAMQIYDGQKLHRTVLSADETERTAENLLRMKPEERAKLAGMEKGREDIIAGGAYLFSKVLKVLSVDKAYFSDADNLEGYLVYRGLI